MAKPGKSKKACEKYKQQGRKEKNKQLKQERQEKRLAKFKARREAGKSYEYKKKDKPTRNEDHRLPYQVWTSIMAKLDNKIRKEKAETKLLNFKNKNVDE